MHGARLPQHEQRALVQSLKVRVLSTFFRGLVTRGATFLFANVAPAMLLPRLLGNTLYIGSSVARFRQLVLALLTRSGLALRMSFILLLLGP